MEDRPEMTADLPKDVLIEREREPSPLRVLFNPVVRTIGSETRDFFEGYKGLKALAPLYQRVQVNFGEDAQWDNIRAPQVRLQPFTDDRLLAVGKRIRALYPAKNAERVAARADDRFLSALVAQVTAGFGGKVALAPRLFLRELIDVMDRVDLHEGYDPAAHYHLELADGKLTPEELAAKHGWAWRSRHRASPYRSSPLSLASVRAKPHGGYRSRSVPPGN